MGACGGGGKAGGQCPAPWQLGRVGRSCRARAGASGAPNFPSGFLPSNRLFLFEGRKEASDFTPEPDALTMAWKQSLLGPRGTVWGCDGGAAAQVAGGPRRPRGEEGRSGLLFTLEGSKTEAGQVSSGAQGASKPCSPAPLSLISVWESVALPAKDPCSLPAHPEPGAVACRRGGGRRATLEDSTAELPGEASAHHRHSAPLWLQLLPQPRCLPAPLERKLGFEGEG